MLMLMVKKEGKERWCRREGQRVKRIHHKCKCISCGLPFWRCRYKTEGVTGTGGRSKARESALAVGSYREREIERSTHVQEKGCKWHQKQKTWICWLCISDHVVFLFVQGNANRLYRTGERPVQSVLCLKCLFTTTPHIRAPSLVKRQMGITLWPASVVQKPHKDIILVYHYLCTSTGLIYKSAAFGRDHTV